MQMMFFRQHFGSLAIGLSNADETSNQRKTLIEEKVSREDRKPFFEISTRGVSHPWSRKKEDEVRVAITGDGMVFYPDVLYPPTTQIFAKVEFYNGEVYLAHRRPYSTIAHGLPEPEEVAKEIFKSFNAYLNDDDFEGSWVVVDKPQVPKYHRSLLGKVMSRVQCAVNQGSDFFKNPKSH